MNDKLAAALETYIQDSKTTKRISIEEATANKKATLISREFTVDKNTIENAQTKDDIQTIFAGVSIEIEDTFSELFMSYRVVAFTGYMVYVKERDFVYVFTVQTLAIDTTEEEWNNG